MFRNDTVEMTAEKFTVERAAGNMTATGSVQTTVRSSSQTGSGGLLSASQPAHVIAHQAQMLHNAQKAIFTGQARLWQGGDSVEAPVIELSQKMQTLTAYGKETCMQCVHAIFLGQGGESVSSAKPKAVPTGRSEVAQARELKPRDASREPSTFRVLSQRLLYSDAERKATFNEHVEAIGSSGTVFADHVEVFLSPAGPHPQAGSRVEFTEGEKKAAVFSNNSQQSSVERIVAEGHVVLEQQGRRGTGTRLVYTASDGRFLLTGDDVVAVLAVEKPGAIR